MNDMTHTDEHRMALNRKIAQRLRLTAQDAINWDWVNEFESAMTLLVTSGAYWNLDGGGALKIASLRMYDDKNADVHMYGTSDDLALLISETWLAWHDAAHPETPTIVDSERKD